MKDFIHNFATVTMDDRTDEGIPSIMDDLIINAIRPELRHENFNAWNFFEIALHALKKNKHGMESLLDLLRENVGNHIVGIFGVHDDRIADSYLIIAIYNRLYNKVDFYNFEGSLEDIDIILNFPREDEEEGDPSPSEEDMIAMFEEFESGFGEALDAAFIAGMML